MLERVAGEVARLRFLLRDPSAFAQVPDLAPGVAQLQGRLSEHSDRLRGRLTEALSDVLRGAAGAVARGDGAGAEARSQAAHLLHAFRADGSEARALETARGALVGPAMRAAAAEAQAAEGAGGGGGGGVAGFFSRAAGIAELVCQLLADEPAGAGDGADGGAGAGDGADGGRGGGALGRGRVLGECVLPEVGAVVGACFPGHTSPGKPREFTRGYVGCVGFLRAAEGLCASRAEVARLRESGAEQELLGRWNVRAYAALRFQEVAAPVEAALGRPLAGLAAAPAGGPAGLRWAALGRAWEALGGCLPDEPGAWEAPHLAERMLRTALQVVARVAAHLADAAGGGDGGGGGGGGFTEGASAEDWVALAVDVSAFQRRAREEWAAEVARAAGPSERGAAAAARAVEEGLAALGPAAGAALSRAGALAVAEGGAPIAQIKGVAASLRMSARAAAPGPPAPSPHVAAVAAPLRALLASCAALGVAAPDADRLRHAVAAGVAAEYAAQVRDLMVSVARTESSLALLKRGRGGPAAAEAGPGPGGGDNVRKVADQMRADAEHFVTLLEAEGVARDRLPEVGALLAACDAGSAGA